MPSSFGQATLFSNEADNEHSLRALFYHSGNMMNGDDITQMRQPQYEGDDARPTSRKELWGWYAYAWAAEVFVVCGVGSFIPITLESLARERGVLAENPRIPCNSPQGVSILSVTGPHRQGHQCIIQIPGGSINTASFAMYTFSFSVLVQAMTIITMSGAADHGRFRKTLLLAFAFIGALATMSFLPVHSGVFWIAPVLAIISNTCIGASFVLLNSFLPVLVRHHPTVLDPKSANLGDDQQGQRYSYDGAEIENEHDLAPTSSISSSQGLLTSTHKPDNSPGFAKSPATISPELQMSTKISSTGISTGYVSAILVQILSVFILYKLGQSTFSLRVVLFLVGAWWFLFSIPCIFWLRPRPGPPLHHLDPNASATTTLFAYLAEAWKSLFRTIARARRLKDVLLFLAAWFLLADASATVAGTAVLFAKTSLGMKPAALAAINVVVMISGIIGALSWTRLSLALNLSPVQTILACLLVFELIPCYALLGYIPAVQRLGYLGLQQQWEVYPVAFVYGLVVGGLSSYCRALFGELIPAGFEATFYSLYAITDKGSSVFGPLVVGAITDATGDIRPAFWFLAAMIAAPFPLMATVDVERGKKEGSAMIEVLDVHCDGDEDEEAT